MRSAPRRALPGLGRTRTEDNKYTGIMVAALVLVMGLTSFFLIVPVQSAHAETLGSWTPTTSYIGAASMSCVVSGGYIYCVGGNTPQMGAISAAYYAPLSASGIGTWTQTTSYPQVGPPVCATSGGYIYCLGPNPGANSTTPAYFAALSSSGIGPWANTTSFPSTTVNPPTPPSYTSPLTIDSCVVAQSYIYCVGTPSSAGFSYGQAPPDLVYYATVSSSGVGAWTQTTTYPYFLQGQKCVVAPSTTSSSSSNSSSSSGEFVYCVGGDVPPYDGESQTFASGAVEYAPVLPTGGLGAWTSTTSYPLDITGQSCFTWGAYVYCAAGGVFVDGGSPTNGYKDAVYYAQVAPQGGIAGGWVQTTTYPINDTTLSCVADSGYAYCLGGQISSFAAAGAAYYTQISAPPTSSSTSQLTVSTTDQGGSPIAGFYTVLYDSSGNVTSTGFSPSDFVLNNGQSYTVQADGYGSCTFDHWTDTGSTSPQRTVSISGDTQLTAVYDCAQSTLSVSTTNLAGAPLAGYYTTLSLSDGGTTIGSCFSACSFTVDNGQDYVVTVANYGGETLTQWSDGAGSVYAWGGSHYLAVPNGSGNSGSLSLTAVYAP